MAVSASLSRPLSALTEAENNSITGVASDDSSTFTLDFKATINSGARLLGRTRVTIETSGALQRYKYEFLNFTSSADQTYSDGDRTTPFSDAEADNAASVHLIGYSPWVDMHELHNTAGDTTAS